jgi:hypothetical protein
MSKGRKGGYENQNHRPTFMSQAAAPQEATYEYTKPTPISYGGEGYRQAPSPFATEEPTFGKRLANRSEMNIGGDGGERSSVKVHHAPGGSSSLNIFGGGEYQAPTVSHSKASYGYTPPAPAFGGRVPLKETYADQYAPKYGAYEPPVSRVPEYNANTFSQGPSFVPT